MESPLNFISLIVSDLEKQGDIISMDQICQELYRSLLPTQNKRQISN